jgi:acetyl esterase/lipase
MAILPTALDLLNMLVRRGAGAVTRDCSYGAHPRKRLDIYHAPAGQAAPVIVFFYGGSWEEGERSDYAFVGAALAERGFTTVVPDYRVYPEVRFPAFIEDAAEAVNWTRRNIARNGGDPSRVVVMGHSAGAHLAAMLTLDRRWLARAGAGEVPALCGFAGLAGPYDFLPLHSDTLKRIFGPEERLPATQPINFVQAGTPPCFLATGLRDRTVDPGNSERLAQRLRGVGGQVVLKTYAHLNHRTLIGALSPALRFLGPVLRDVTAFAGQVTAKRDVAA